MISPIRTLRLEESGVAIPKKIVWVASTGEGFNRATILDQLATIDQAIPEEFKRIVILDEEDAKGTPRDAEIEVYDLPIRSAHGTNFRSGGARSSPTNGAQIDSISGS